MHALKISEFQFKEGEVSAERITLQQNNMKKSPYQLFSSSASRDEFTATFS